MTPEGMFGQAGGFLWQLLKAWWWLALPFLLYHPFVFFWLWWRQELWAAKQPKILLEIKIPKEILKPIKAMENVLSGFWITYDPPNFKEKWWDGKYLLSLSLEIASFGGETHFFVRAPKAMQNVIESSIHAEYPEAEIKEVPDYTKKVPQDIPNQEWDLWGSSMQLLKPDVYPLKTYAKFFEEQEGLKEEKRLDPMAGLLEGLARLKPEEQIWIQIIVKPVTNEENNFIDRGKEIVAEIVKRPKKPGQKLIIREALELLVFGPPKQEEAKEQKEFIPPEMKLTPGERETVAAIEEKISKNVFESAIRIIYLGPKKVFFKPNLKIILGFFAQFSTQGLNAMKPWKKITTGVTYFPKKRREYLRKRRIFRLYQDRLASPYYPRSVAPGGKQGVFILNTQELATMFHFPGYAVAQAPSVRRLEAKRGEAPPDLPTA